MRQRCFQSTRDHARIARQSAAHTFKQALLRLLRTDREISRTEECSLSYRYFDHLKRKYLFPKLGLLAVLVCGVAVWMFLDDVRSLKIAAAALVGFLLLKLKETVIGLRVASGYFGSSESEVRDLLRFITAHYGDHDDREESALTKSALD